MSDLLGSILNSMDKPPTIGDPQQKKLLKQQREHLQKKQEQEKQELRKFREKIEDVINKFIQDPTNVKHKFEPMGKVHRSIVHDIAEVAGLTAFSFGEDEVDRHVMVFKKEYAPSDEELQAYRRGEEWDPQKAKEAARLKQLEREAEQEAEKSKPQVAEPASNYKEKYQKLLGKDAGKDAAKIATPNKQFGFVPSANKRDQRSIEQTLADIRAKKRQRTEEEGP